MAIPMRKMVVDTWYKVVRGTRCGSLQKGDFICLRGDGKVDCKQAAAWMDPSDFSEMGGDIAKAFPNVRLEVANELYEVWRKKKMADVERYDQIIHAAAEKGRTR